MKTLQKFPRRTFWCLFAIMLILGQFGVVRAQSSRSTVNPKTQEGPARVSRQRVGQPSTHSATQNAKTPVDQAPNRKVTLGMEPNDPSGSASGLRFWTATGATGTSDEDSTAIVSHDDFAVQLKDGLTGTATVRYNITATRGISAFCPAASSLVNVRFRNSDNTGAHAQVKFEIHRTGILAGGNDIIFTFNSNGLGAGTAFTSASVLPNIDFDFSNYIYWIDATLFRDQATQFADLGSIEIRENPGTACP